VWLVALRASGVTGLHLTQLLLVTAATRGEHRLRMVRQTAVTIAALLVSGAQRDARQLRCVAVATQGLPQLFQGECVRGMALRAGEALVKILIRVSRLMAAAAPEHRVEQVPRRRVRIMTASARVRPVGLRVIRVNLGVAALARFFGCAAHVMRGVAARALVVRLH